MPYSFEEVQVTIEEGVTALHLAAKFGHICVVQVLLETGRFKAVNDATVHLHYSALHIAARYGHYVVATALLQSGRFNAVNALDVFGSSALHFAAGYGSSDVAKVLLEEPRFTKATRSVSHYSAIDDTISCNAPYSAIGFRGKLFLRYPPPPRPVFGPAIVQFDGEKWGCSSDRLRCHRKHSPTGVLLHLSHDRGGGGISVGSLIIAVYWQRGFEVKNSYFEIALFISGPPKTPTHPHEDPP